MATGKKPGQREPMGANPDDVPQMDGFYLTARPDTVDFRDKLYTPTLVEVPSRRSLQSYREKGAPVLNQEREGACTGFGLAAVANYLLRTRKIDPDVTTVSPRMLYEMAKRNDEWQGEEYAGSSARGAIKGWHKFGVCETDKWPYVSGKIDRNLTLEPLARLIGGKSQWDEMKENALRATTGAKGGARVVAEELEKLVAGKHIDEIHVVAHSAGSILMAPLLTMIAAYSAVQTVTLWAPACTMDLFKEHYVPLLTGANRKIKALALYILTDQAERDDHCANIYHKSLLYLVSQAFERDFQPIDPNWPGVPLLGMEKFAVSDPHLKKLHKEKVAEWVLAPNDKTTTRLASRSTSHGGFDDDKTTVIGTLARILGAKTKTLDAIGFARSAASLRNRREVINRLI